MSAEDPAGAGVKAPSSLGDARDLIADPLRRYAPGVLLAATVAAASGFLGEHYGAPAMLFALLIGMAFNFLAEDERCAAGLALSAKTLLRIGVAMLGVRLSFADIGAFGLAPSLTVLGLVAFTVTSGAVAARLLGQSRSFGLLAGGAVAICGASAALALACVLPKRESLERDTAFVVIGVTALSTIAMVLYPILGHALGLDDRGIGFLLGASIHDVAQVVGAGYSVGEEAGDVATLTKLGRVALLPAALLLVVAMSGGARREVGGGMFAPPWFVVAFLALAALNSLGGVPEEAREGMNALSRGLLITAIAALGVRTSLKAMVSLGGRCALVVVAATLSLLAAASLAALALF